MLRKWGMLVLALLITPVLAFAQNTGKVSGVVTDGETGDPLPGASVVLVGTQLGTISDVDGNYFIIGVPVGTYDVQASFVGFGTQTVANVEVSSGYTREINFTLSPGVQLDEIVVEYERPLIQKDAVGVPKIVTAEDIVNLPVRGATSVAAIQAGVVNKEGSGTLNVRGGRGSEVAYYIDGVKVIGTASIPQSAVQEQEMIIGNISAKYGDAMSGIISITTKSGSTKFFGSFEGVTSQSLDSYGYNLLSGALGGPIMGNKASFFLAGEFTDQTDSGPRAFGQIYLPDNIISDLENNPTAFRAMDANGNDAFLPIPNSVPSGSRLLVDETGAAVNSGGNLVFVDEAGTQVATVAVPDGTDIDGMSLFPVLRAEFLDPNLFEIRKDKRNREFNRLSLSGNLDFNVLADARLRLGGRYVTDEFDGSGSTLHYPFAVNMPTLGTRDDWQVFGTWTHYLSSSTFFQVQADLSDRSGDTWDPRFSDGVPTLNDIFSYSDVDSDPAFAALRGYNNTSFVTETRQVTDDHGTPDPADDTVSDVDVQVPVYTNTYRDGAGPASNNEVIATLVQVPGGRFNGYSQFHNTQMRFNAHATTQVGLHQIEFGGEYESRTNRSWSISGTNMSRYFADASGPESIASDDTELNTAGYTNVTDLPPWLATGLMGGYGYDLFGQNETDDESFAGYISNDKAKPASDYQLAPYKPLYYGGYVQDKIEFRDIVLNVGMRVDVFDNNQRVLKDRFQRRPACLVGDLGTVISIDQAGQQQTTDCSASNQSAVPAGIGSDYTVFYSADEMIGFRNSDGIFFDLNGNVVQGGDLLLGGAPRNTFGEVTPDMFTDYEPQVTVMPRIGVSFPVTDQALFFARYGVTSQRPSSNTFATLAALSGTGGANNPNLKPEKTTEYELGFRQRVGARAALTISGFFRQIENLIQLREIRGTTPSVYSSYENVDFGTVKGLEFGLDLRRSGGISANVNYTMAFADGTGSGSRTTSTIVWVDETPPNFISPLDFDQRHKVNVSVDYRLGAGEGPEIGGIKLLENFGVNVLATAGSGYPYTPVVEPFNLAGAARATDPRGSVNGGRMPWSSRIDIRVDRKFPIAGNTTLSAFVWVQNLLDQVNTNNVWRFTGLPDTDGFRATPEGERLIRDGVPVTDELYSHRNRVLGWVGIPRMTRVGVRLDF